LQRRFGGDREVCGTAAGRNVRVDLNIPETETRPPLVIDPTVTADEVGAMTRAWRARMERYKGFRLTGVEGGRDPVVVPVVYTHLGVAHPKVAQSLGKALGLTQKAARDFLREVATAVVDGTLAVWRAHPAPRPRDNPARWTERVGED
jgi:hypothetical protein